MNSRNSQLAVGVDAGAHRTRVVVCLLEDGALRFLSHGLSPSAGWSKGRIIDQGAVAESIHAAVIDAERGAGISVDAATLGVGGMEIRGAQSRGLYEFGRSHEVDVEDLSYAVSLASEVRLERGRMLLHALPQDFTLDGRSGFRKPQRSYCTRLEANVHIVTTDTAEHQALVAAAHMAHLAVEETVFEPMAAAYACIRPEGRARGAALVDFGMHYWTSHHPYVVPEPMTLEPTESYSQADLDEYIAALKQVAGEAYTEPDIIRTAPHNSTVHQTNHEPFDNPDEWAVTWRAYKRKTQKQ